MPLRIILADLGRSVKELRAHRLLAAVVMCLGAVCVLIALAHIAGGPRAIPGGVFVNTTMDSEDRFYATLFLGWAAGMIYCSRNWAARKSLFGALLLTFFLGGIARIISAVLVGLPNTLFVSLGLLELALPPLLWWWCANTVPLKGGGASRPDR